MARSKHKERRTKVSDLCRKISAAEREQGKDRGRIARAEKLAAEGDKRGA